MTEKIGLQAVLETSDFESGVKIYDSGIDSMEAANEGFGASADDVTTGLTAVDEAAATSGESAVELAAQMELVANAYDAVAAVVGEAVELAELGVQAERVEKNFRAFAGEIGDADELLAAFQRGAGGTVDKMTAMSSASRLLQMGLVGSNDEMEQVVEIATRLGDQTQSAGDRVADFALLLANQSIPRLDNFGISSGKVRDRIAELQKAFPAMSREAAFSQAVFEEGGKSLDVLGIRTQDAGMKMEIAQANIANMRVEMGQRLLPIVASVMGIIAGMNTNTLAMIAVIGGGVPVVMKLSSAIKAMAVGMQTSAVTMGALVVAVTALVVVTDQFNNQMDAMAASQDNAQEAAASLGDKVQALVDDGMSLGDAMAEAGTSVNKATDEFHNAKVLGVIPLSNAFNAGSKFTDTMTEATGSLQGAIVANVDSFAQYTEQVAAYNTGITDTEGKLQVLTEAEFNMASIREKGASATSKIADAILLERNATFGASIAASDLATAEDARMRTTKGAMLAMEGLTAADTAGIEVRMAAQGSIRDITAAEEQRALMAEKVAAVEAMQAASATAAAAALEAKRKKDIETVQAEQALAQSVMNASDAMIAQTFITGLDPEAMGLTAYRSAVENIQLAFGLATPESIALARGINEGVDAINAGDVARDDMEGFISAIIDDSKDATSSFDSLSREFSSSSAESERLGSRLSATGEDLQRVEDEASGLNSTLDQTQSAGTAAASGLDDVGQSSVSTADDIDTATTSLTELDSAMAGTASGAGAHGAAIAGNLGGALSAGMRPLIDDFKGQLQELRNALPGSEPKDTTSSLYGLGDAGRAIIINIAGGMESAGSVAVDTMAEIGTAMGQALANAAEEGTEDLFGIAGTLGGLGSTAGGILQKRTIDPLQDFVDSLSEAMTESSKRFEEMSERGKEIQDIFGGGSEFGRARGLFIGGDLGALTEEQIELMQEFSEITQTVDDDLKFMANNTEALAEAQAELADQQERMQRLQTQQENLRFLQQQAELLALIAEKGLDANAVLGGLELGLDANVEDVIDAMSAAMELVIAQAEEELGIASPSKVFEKIGEETMSGMAMGIERLMSLPVAQSALATQAMVAAPASTLGGNSSTDNSINFGDVNVSGVNPGDMGQARRAGRAIIKQVEESMRGYN